MGLHSVSHQITSLAVLPKKKKISFPTLAPTSFAAFPYVTDPASSPTLAPTSSAAFPYAADPAFSLPLASPSPSLPPPPRPPPRYLPHQIGPRGFRAVPLGIGRGGTDLRSTRGLEMIVSLLLSTSAKSGTCSCLCVPPVMDQQRDELEFFLGVFDPLLLAGAVIADKGIPFATQRETRPADGGGCNHIFMWFVL